MKIKQIEYSLSKAIQIQNFEPVRFFVGATAEVQEGEDIEKSYEQLKKIVHEQIKQDYERVRPSQTPTEKFVKEIKAIKSVKELGEYYKKNKDKHKSVEFNKCVANRKVEIHEGI